MNNSTLTFCHQNLFFTLFALVWNCRECSFNMSTSSKESSYFSSLFELISLPDFVSSSSNFPPRSNSKRMLFLITSVTYEELLNKTVDSFTMIYLLHLSLQLFHTWWSCITNSISLITGISLTWRPGSTKRIIMLFMKRNISKDVHNDCCDWSKDF